MSSKKKLRIRPYIQGISKARIGASSRAKSLKIGNIDTEYEYGIYSKGLATKVKSKKIKFAKSKTLCLFPFLKIQKEGK